MKLCKDCKFYRPESAAAANALRAKCGHDEFVSPVDGSANILCSVLRDDDDCCGREGEYWQPKTCPICGGADMDCTYGGAGGAA